MIGNPYYQMLGLMQGQDGLQVVPATLADAREDIFYLGGRKAPIAGRARGLTLEPSDEGQTFLCVGSPVGWFVICPLEEV